MVATRGELRFFVCASKRCCTKCALAAGTHGCYCAAAHVDTPAQAEPLQSAPLLAASISNQLQGVSAAELGQQFAYASDVLVSGKCAFDDAGYRAFLVNDVGDSLGADELHQSAPRTVSLRDLFIRVSEQREADIVLCTEFSMTLVVVGRHADYLHGFAELDLQIAKPASLCGAHAGEIAWIKVENDRAFVTVARQQHACAVGRGCIDFRCNGANSESHRSRLADRRAVRSPPIARRGCCGGSTDCSREHGAKAALTGLNLRALYELPFQGTDAGTRIYAMNTTQKINDLETVLLRDGHPDFRVGDTVRVHYKIVEGDKDRIQIFQGVVLKRHRAGARSTFTVRKISFSIGVERVFLTHSPRVDKVEIVSRGVVRRARLFYLRDLSGKAARVRDAKDN
jgi:large subunit ribosomal protein L19